MARARGRLNTTGSVKSPTTLHDQGTEVAPDGSMMVVRSNKSITQPTPEEQQKMKELMFIRKNPTTTT
jgi:hypothetical protein